MAIVQSCYDVIVAGGGLSGFAAARACAQAGLNTLIVERRPLLGWEATWGFALDFADGASDTSQAIATKMTQAGGMKDGRLDAPILEIMLDREARENKISLLYYAQPVAPLLEGERMVGLLVAGKSGEMTLRASVFVDATENGLLWQRAGTEVKRPEGAAQFSIFINGVPPISLPQKLESIAGSQNIILKPSVWPGEVAVEFQIPRDDVCLARRTLPEILKELRRELGLLESSLVTHVSVEPVPLTSGQTLMEDGYRHPLIINLFAAGDWASPESISTLTVAKRLDSGESVGNEVVKQFADLARKRPQEDVPVQASLASPPLFESDVVVVGGGTAGAIAAIAAAREGATTTLLEASTFLGGIGTGGGIHSYYHGIKGGLQDEVDERVQAMTPLFGPADKVDGFHPEAKKVVLQEMADEAGVNLIFETTVTGVEMADLPGNLPAKGTDHPPRKIIGVVAVSPEGNAAHRAQVFIDCSGDGDVAFLAGAPFTFGREGDGLPHAYSQAAGVLDETGRLRIVNFDAGYCDPTDVEDLTRARRLGLRHFERDHYTADTRLVYIAPLIGLRNSRQIVGDYRLTLADEVMGRQFPDVIAYARSHYDNHAPDYENESDEAVLWVWLLGNWRTPIGCEVPYRCLLPQGVEGLLVACRALSLTQDAHYQLRMQRDMQRIGEAAGIAAALSVKHRVTPRELSVRMLQERLLRTGALEAPSTRQLRQQAETPDASVLSVAAEERFHTTERLSEAALAASVDQLIELLEGDNPRSAVWHLCLQGEAAIPGLRRALKSESPETRFWASVALAMLNQPEAAPALRECVQRRQDDRPETLRSAPTWFGAMVLLGRLKDKEAVPAIVEVLQDPSVELDALIAAVRALGRIGDPAAIAAIEQLVQREDLPTTRTLKISTGPVSPVQEDSRYQLDLAAAEALGRMGKQRRDLVERHLHDERAYVRRYAQRLLTQMKASPSPD